MNAYPEHKTEYPGLLFCLFAIVVVMLMCVKDRVKRVFLVDKHTRRNPSTVSTAEHYG
jgi:hypothetical protein